MTIKDYYNEVDAELEAIYETNREAALEFGLLQMRRRFEFENGIPRSVPFEQVQQAEQKFKRAFDDVFTPQQWYEMINLKLDIEDNNLFKYVEKIEAEMIMDDDARKHEAELEAKETARETELRKKVQSRQRVNLSGSFQYAMYKLNKLKNEGAISKPIAEEYEHKIARFFRTQKAYVMNEVFKHSVYKKRKKEFEEFGKKRLEEADAMLAVALDGIAYNGNSVGIALSIALTGGFSDNDNEKGNDKNFNMK